MKPCSRAILLIIFFLFNNISAGATNTKGLYFAKKEYTHEQLPVYNKIKQEIPAPILEDNPEWEDLYWKCWEIAFTKLRQPAPGSNLVSNYIDEAFSDNIFQWDTIFIIMFARYVNHILPAIQSLDNFYCRQHENGFICRELRESDGSDFYYFFDYFGTNNVVNPPLFSWGEVESYKVTGDKSRYKMVIPVLEKYAEWLEKYRKKPGTKHGLYWNTGLGAGMDNTPRNGSGWVCMSSQMVVLYRDLADMCNEIGDTAKSEKYSKIALLIGEKINTWMWNEKDGLYYDVDDNGIQVKWKTIACFWPMFAGIASELQMEKLVAHITDPNSFWRLIPFPSHAADEEGYCPDGCYWRGGVWAPTNHMVIKGLEFNGYNEIAAEASERYIQGIYKIYEQTGTVWENYAPDFYHKSNKSRPNFVGFSGCGPIALLIENVIGIKPSGADNSITWTLRRHDRHGIKNLVFGHVKTTLICEELSPNTEKRWMNIKSSSTYTLNVVLNGKRQTFNINKGEQTIQIN